MPALHRRCRLGAYPTQLGETPEEIMTTISRRRIAAAAFLASGASALARTPAFAETADATAVANAVAGLTKAMLAADKAGLESLVADQLSYGHSGGVVQDKAAFVDVIAS